MPSGSGFQYGRVVGNVIRHESLDEVIAVVVAGLHPERQRLSRFLARIRKQMRAQLLDEKLVRITLVDENFRAPGASFHQLGCVVGTPERLVLAKIVGESLQSPGASGWRANRGEVSSCT